ncbi:hypothetical protein L4X63_02105 [Geomonas sp. Red32]|uniref:hypothetical protein n=1 Tax=Geomonas sp. Red32 TaxID=2912856 RepID=UPI00202CFC90|nr:hypothetical protein [Geomonas sp. Red32]MCM0080372.1 hypothetical protein [Geomonas sp. Red32]
MELLNEELVARLYYHMKPFIPRRVQLGLRSLVARQKRFAHRGDWPIDQTAAAAPPGFFGWPDGKRFALVLTHDVDTARGVARCQPLMELEMEAGFRSSFNFVARDYYLPADFRRRLAAEGFEVGVHGLEHGRQLYESAAAFAEHARGINRCLADWNAVGFRSPCMYHNFDWLHALEIKYDASSFDTDPFEPQSDGVSTIYPFYHRQADGEGYVELPYTLPQDFTVFVLFAEQDIEIWKRKLAWLAEWGGMALLITHPDYMSFDHPPCFDEYPAERYRELLTHLTTRYQGEFWHPLPREMAAFWKEQVVG